MASKAQSVPVPRWVNSYSRLPHTSATDDDSTIISSISAGDAPLYLDPVISLVKLIHFLNHIKRFLSVKEMRIRSLVGRGLGRSGLILEGQLISA